MAKVTNWQCDECKETMREAYRSSWLLIDVGETFLTAHVWHDQAAESISLLHICGQECALKVFSRKVGEWSQQGQVVAQYPE